MKASPEPTKKNCGINRKTLIGRVEIEVVPPIVLATDKRLFSAMAAAAIPIVESTSPIEIFCRLVRPVKKNESSSCKMVQ